MSRVPPRGAGRRAQQLESLVSELRLTRGEAVRESAGRLALGVPEIDRLLSGGLPIGALTELSGTASSGRTSLALTLLAAVTERGELAGWVDGADAFDPPSAQKRGVDLERVLWVRSTAWSDALSATERLVRTEGFPLVLLDGSEFSVRETVSHSSWLRLTRLLSASHTTLLLLSTERLAGPHAALTIEMQPARARFSGSPSLLDEIETRMTLVRNRAAPVDPNTSHPVPVKKPIMLTRSNPPRESAA